MFFVYVLGVCVEVYKYIVKSKYPNRPFCANVGVVDEHAQSMLNIHFREKNSFVLPKLYLTEVYIEHAHQLTTERVYSEI